MGWNNPVILTIDPNFRPGTSKWLNPGNSAGANFWGPFFGTGWRRDPPKRVKAVTSNDQGWTWKVILVPLKGRYISWFKSVLWIMDEFYGFPSNSYMTMIPWWWSDFFSYILGTPRNSHFSIHEPVSLQKMSVFFPWNSGTCVFPKDLNGERNLCDIS